MKKCEIKCSLLDNDEISEKIYNESLEKEE